VLLIIVRQSLQMGLVVLSETSGSISYNYNKIYHNFTIDTYFLSTKGTYELGVSDLAVALWANLGNFFIVLFIHICI
jgi:hypothetical protein